MIGLVLGLPQVWSGGCACKRWSRLSPHPLLIEFTYDPIDTVYLLQSKPPGSTIPSETPCTALCRTQCQTTQWYSSLHRTQHRRSQALSVPSMTWIPHPVAKMPHQTLSGTPYGVLTDPPDLTPTLPPAPGSGPRIVHFSTLTDPQLKAFLWSNLAFQRCPHFPLYFHTRNMVRIIMNMKTTTIRCSATQSQVSQSQALLGASQ